MKVALLNTYPHGGAGVACRRLAQALPSVGVEAHLLTRDDAGKKWPFYAERLSFLPYEKDKTVRFSFSPANFGTDLRKNKVVQQADVIHLHWINQGFLSLKNIAQLAELGKPLVWTLHDMWAFTGGCHYSGDCRQFEHGCGSCPYVRRPGPNDLSSHIFLQKQRYFPKKMHFVTCSGWLAGLARESALLRDYPVVDIPNPIDTAVFAPVTDAERLAYRQSLGAPPDAWLLLFVAMKISEKRKGFHLLKNALEHLKATRPDLPLRIMVLGKGDPEALSALPYPVHPLGLVHDVKLLTQAYAAADVFAIPSLEDNLPNTVMEALACGVPVVGFRTGGIPEMVQHGDQGFLAVQGDVESFANGILNVLEGEVPHSAYRLSARRKATEQYAHSVVAGRYKALYEKALNVKTAL
ncbi:MAG: glycosyltransferase family 4 protein [Saprospiraceae bacterium]